MDLKQDLLQGGTVNYDNDGDNDEDDDDNDDDNSDDYDDEYLKKKKHFFCKIIKVEAPLEC